VRLNLDPFQQCTDEEVVNILEKVRLWSKVVSSDDLDSDFDPFKFSVGELQLLSLARAILQYRGQRTRLILMDEATSSLDEGTELLVQKLVSEEFADCTVVSVAHRLETICRADRVVFMEGGRIVDVVEPGKLRDKAVIE
jgi:ABC-type multidrug transport system fused ATPase/permease subunit